MQTQKEQKTNIGEIQTQRAFWISIGTGVVMLIIMAIFLVTDSGRELKGWMDVRVFVAVIMLSGFVSAWLTRRGKALLGVSLILISLYISVVLTALSISNVGIAIAAVTVALTFSITSAVFPPRAANRMSIAVLFLAGAIVSLDIFQPFERIPNDTPEITWGLAIFLVLVYGAFVFRHFASYTLRTKLIIAFLLASLIPLAVIAFLNDRNTRSALTDGANQALLSAASLTATQLDTFITTNLDTIRTQASLPDFSVYLSQPTDKRADGYDEIVSILSTFARQNSIYISSVALYDLNGLTQIDTFSDDIGTDKSSRDWFQKAIETGLPYASNVEFSQTTSEASIYFSAPVRDAAGKIIGVIRTRYNASILQDFIYANNGLIGTSSYPLLIDENYVRLANGNDPTLIFKSITQLDVATVRDLQKQRRLPPGSPSELATDLVEFQSSLENVDTQPFFAGTLAAGANQQAATIRTKTQPWLVVFTQAQSEFLTPINAQARNNIILFVATALAVTGFGLLMAQTLSGPIVRLTQTAEKIAGGDINIQAKVETSDEIGTLAGTFNRMTQQLRDFIASLEERVAARTKDLATVAEVGTATATILETDKLLQEVVNLSKERFNLYHSHIYLLDEKGENLVLASGAGEAGRQMKAKGLSIPLNREQSLVARAAREQKGVTVNDVTQAPDFLPNPLLPNTRSELAVPMIVGGKVIGVFDVQSDVIGRFTDSDINIQTTLAAQVSTSIQNVRSFEQSKAQADLESLVNEIGQKIQRATTVDDTLQTAIREIGLALGATRVSASIGISAAPASNGSQASDTHPVR
jgi:putative methionine-R-sulfoxide reductase with GAF domain